MWVSFEAKAKIGWSWGGGLIGREKLWAPCLTPFQLNNSYLFFEEALLLWLEEGNSLHLEILRGNKEVDVAALTISGALTSDWF